MKKYWVFFLLFFSLSINAGILPSSIYQDYLPKKVQVFLDRHFGKFKIEKLKYDAEDGECKVKYANGIEVEFDYNGDWEEIESDYIPLPKSIVDILPLPAIDFIAKRYPRRPIKKIKRKHDGYKVKLDGSLDIVFGKDGTILKIDD